jgi:putative flippase GtrA
MIITNSQERTRFLRFAVVGTIGALVDFLVFNLMTNVVKLIPVWSSVISFSVAVVSNYLLNRFWTYPDSRSKSVTRQMVQFIIVSLIGLGIRTPLFAWLEKILVQFFSNLQVNLPFTPTFWGHNFALAIAIIVVMFWNFFANRFWTYSDVRAVNVNPS